MDFSELSGLGWKPFFQQQLTIDEWDTAIIARVSSRDRSVLSDKSRYKP